MMTANNTTANNRNYRDGGDCSPEQEEERIDDWGLPCEFFLFAQHQAQPIWLGRTTPAVVEKTTEGCVSTVATVSSRDSSSEEKNDPKVPSLNDDTSNNDNSRCQNSNIKRNDDSTTSSLFLQILCVESLTPLDMMHLSTGEADSTGHCVWTASFLWIAALASHVLPRLHAMTTLETTTTTTTTTTMTTTTKDTAQPQKQPQEQQQQQQQQQQQLRVLELGSGTGLGGLALLKAWRTVSSNVDVHLTLTDADPAALDLCRRNVQLNGYNVATNNNTKSYNQVLQSTELPDIDTEEPLLLEHTVVTSTTSVDVQKLVWGGEGDDSSLATPGADVVVAADILYDIRMLPAICTTAVTALRKQQSHRQYPSCTTTSRPLFFLSHVPRACYNSTTDAHSPEVLDLEGYIVKQMCESGELVHLETVRPNELPASVEDAPADCLNCINRQELQAIGAALLVFALER